MSFALIRWRRGKTIEVIPTSSMKTIKGITKAKWSDGNWYHVLRILAIGDNRDFLQSLRVNEEGVIVFSEHDDGNDEEDEECGNNFENDSDSQDASTQTDVLSLMQHEGTQTEIYEQDVEERAETVPKMHCQVTQTEFTEQLCHGHNVAVQTDAPCETSCQATQTEPIGHQIRTQTIPLPEICTQGSGTERNGCGAESVCIKAEAIGHKIGTEMIPLPQICTQGSQTRRNDGGAQSVSSCEPVQSQLFPGQEIEESTASRKKRLPPCLVPSAVPQSNDEPSTSTGVTNQNRPYRIQILREWIDEQVTSNGSTRSSPIANRASPPDYSAISDPSLPRSSNSSPVRPLVSHSSTSPGEYVTLLKDSSVIILKSDRENIIFNYKSNPREMVRRLLIKLVGLDSLIKMTPLGNPKREFDAIPSHIYRDVRRFVNKKCNSSLDATEYRETCGALCRRLRNPKK